MEKGRPNIEAIVEEFRRKHRDRLFGNGISGFGMDYGEPTWGDYGGWGVEDEIAINFGEEWRSDAIIPSDKSKSEDR